MFCPNCGHEVQEGAAFCSECGGKIVTMQAAPVEQVSETYTAPASTVSTGSETGLTAYANNRNIRIGVAIALVACIFFLPFFSIMGVYSINGFDMIKLLFDGFENISQTMDMADVPTEATIGIYAFIIGLIIFMITSVCVLLGAVKNSSSMERKSALLGLISGIALFVGIYLVLNAVKDAAMDTMGYMGSDVQMGASTVLSMISPFKLLGTGYWGGIILYAVSLVLNKKRTNA